ncbi:hypothetical protein BSL78_09897 [Apostichopus japonicus]|uniref:Uncharacterized protein n=1 Tax=Stichopus japonicus TaxID=307972 RepID=A0A2G8KYW1_STIJA|nr:hypothetical protein BSL78_09897 [Apostichopus japonicus]
MRHHIWRDLATAMLPYQLLGIVPFSPSLKSKAFRVKKMMDGFFEPQDMLEGNNSSVVKLFPCRWKLLDAPLQESRRKPLSLRSRSKLLSCEVATTPFPAKSPQAPLLRSPRRPLSSEVTATPLRRSRHKPHLHVKSEVAARSLQASLRRSRRKPFPAKSPQAPFLRSRRRPLSGEVTEPPFRRIRHKPHLHVKSEVAARSLQALSGEVAASPFPAKSLQAPFCEVAAGPSGEVTATPFPAKSPQASFACEK